MPISQPPRLLIEKPLLKHPIFWFLVVLLALRITYVIQTDLALFYDEAYYHFWSLTPDWGYYSKPPMVAWVITISTQIFGHFPEWTLKIGASVLYFFTALVIFDLGRRLFDAVTGWVAAIVFFTSPLIGFNSLFITTDAPLLLFWALTVWFFVLALQTDRLIYWAGAGIVCGLGLMSKYTMGVLMLALFTFLLLSANHRAKLSQPGPWLAVALSTLFFLPNILWNISHDFISLRHLSEISGLEKELFHPNKLVEFLAGQVFVFGPVAFWLFIRLLFRKSPHDNFRILWISALAMFALISLLALLARAHLNWAAATYVTASLLVAYAITHTFRYKLLAWFVGVNIVSVIVFYFYQSILGLLGVEPSKSNDPFHRVQGWREVTEKTETVVPKPRDYVWVSDSRKLLSYAHYYLSDFAKGEVLQVRGFNVDGIIKDQYELNWDLAKVPTNKSMIFLAEEPKKLGGCFKSVEDLGEVTQQTYPTLQRSVYLYRVEGFIGYGCHP